MEANKPNEKKRITLQIKINSGNVPTARES